MLSLQSKLVESCTLYTNGTDRYGDNVLSAPVVTSCLYEDISTLRQANYQLNISIDGRFWFPPTSKAEEGNIVLYNSEHFQIVKVIQGKRLLLGAGTDFIKCEVTRLRQIS